MDAAIPADEVRAVTHWRTGEVIARARVADRFFSRLKGLLGNRKGLAPGEGLLISPCNSIHTWFMAFPIDVVFLDGEGRVVGLYEQVPPWRVISPVKGARQALELPAGTWKSRGLVMGDILMIEKG